MSAFDELPSSQVDDYEEEGMEYEEEDEEPSPSQQHTPPPPTSADMLYARQLERYHTAMSMEIPTFDISKIIESMAKYATAANGTLEQASAAYDAISRMLTAPVAKIPDPQPPPDAYVKSGGILARTMQIRQLADAMALLKAFLEARRIRPEDMASKNSLAYYAAGRCVRDAEALEFGFTQTIHTPPQIASLASHIMREGPSQANAHVALALGTDLWLPVALTNEMREGICDALSRANEMFSAAYTENSTYSLIDGAPWSARVAHGRSYTTLDREISELITSASKATDDIRTLCKLAAIVGCASTLPTDGSVIVVNTAFTSDTEHSAPSDSVLNPPRNAIPIEMRVPQCSRMRGANAFRENIVRIGAVQTFNILSATFDRFFLYTLVGMPVIPVVEFLGKLNVSPAVKFVVAGLCDIKQILFTSAFPMFCKYMCRLAADLLETSVADVATLSLVVSTAMWGHRTYPARTQTFVTDFVTMNWGVLMQRLFRSAGLAYNDGVVPSTYTDARATRSTVHPKDYIRLDMLSSGAHAHLADIAGCLPTESVFALPAYYVLMNIESMSPAHVLFVTSYLSTVFAYIPESWFSTAGAVQPAQRPPPPITDHAHIVVDAAAGMLGQLRHVLMTDSTMSARAYAKPLRAACATLLCSPQVDMTSNVRYTHLAPIPIDVGTLARLQRDAAVNAAADATAAAAAAADEEEERSDDEEHTEEIPRGFTSQTEHYDTP